MKTVRQHLEELNQLVNSNPECLDMPLVTRDENAYESPAIQIGNLHLVHLDNGDISNQHDIEMMGIPEEMPINAVGC